MKKTDMELQAIREKLQLLKAEQSAAEGIPDPWSPPKPATAVSPHRSEPSGERQAQAAIEALQQRSRRQGSAAQAQAEGLIAQEIYRLEVQAHSINVRSQQQAADIMAMKRSAQQATVALARQGIHDHPQLGAIAQFFASYQSAVVPCINRDAQGNFILSYTTIDFDDAEQAAVDVAQSLRARSKSALFSQPIESSAASGHPNIEDRIGESAEREKRSDQAVAVYSAVFESDWPQAAIEYATRRFRRLRRQARRLHRQNVVQGGVQEGAASTLDLEESERSVSNGYLTSQYSLLDGAIWFSSAALVLLAVKATTMSHSLIRTSVIVLLVGAICFALYQIVFTKPSYYSLLYRLFAAMFGLSLASFLSGLL